jgi:hypothetical protein
MSQNIQPVLRIECPELWHIAKTLSVQRVLKVVFIAALDSNKQVWLTHRLKSIKTFCSLCGRVESWDSSFAIVTRLQAGQPRNRGFSPGRGKRPLPPKRPDWLWSPLRLLINETGKYFTRGNATGAGSWSLPQLELRLRINGAISLLSHMLSQCERDILMFLSLYGRLGMSRRLLLTVQCTTTERNVLFSYLETPHLQEHIGHTMPVSFWTLRLFETLFAPRNI